MYLLLIYLLITCIYYMNLLHVKKTKVTFLPPFVVVKAKLPFIFYLFISNLPKLTSEEKRRR